MFCNCRLLRRNRFVSIFRSNKERTLFGLGPKPPFPFPFAQKTQKYAEKRLLGYTPTELYDVVVDVKKYREFVPWCVKSDVLGLEYPGMFKARMEIGFPPVKESYNALVTYHKPTVVKSVCTEGKLFNHLTTEWKFLPGIETNPKSCTLDFFVSFEFHSVLHAKMATMFFDQVVRQMVNAFLKRAQVLYGPPSMPPHRIS